jgi:hypothetical protein
VLELGIHWDLSLYFFNTIIKAKQECNHPFFMEIFSIAAWEIWKQRNNKIFRNMTPSFRSWKENFISTAKQQSYRLNEDNRTTKLSWLDSIYFSGLLASCIAF